MKTLDDVIRICQKIKADSGGGSVPVRVHIDEQDQIFDITNIQINDNNEDGEILIFTNGPIR